MKTFKPKKYLEGKMTEDTCKHELLSTSGFDEGMYGTTFHCMICNKTIHQSAYNTTGLVLEDKFIFKDLGCLSIHERELIDILLKYIAQRYIHEKAIDIAKLFQTIYPSIEQIAHPLNEITTTDRQLVHEKYQKLLNE